MTEPPNDIAAQRVDHALRRFQETWAARFDGQALSQDLDELDIAVGLWLDQFEKAVGAEEETG